MYLLLFNVSGTLGWVMIMMWALIFVVTLVIELETMNLTTVWFCLSALVTLILGVTIVGDPLIQIAIFVGLSLTLVILTRPLTKKMMRTDIIRTNTDRLVGMVGDVTKEITPNNIGEVKVDRSFWRAINNDDLTFEVGEKVSVDAIVGIKLIVSKISDNPNIEKIRKK